MEGKKYENALEGLRDVNLSLKRAHNSSTP